MPKLWTDTIETHRQTVRDATLDAAANLARTRGLRSVTMSQIAEAAGIGRATLYKYFADVDAVLLAWHERQVDQHLTHLRQIRARTDAPDQLAAVLEEYALLAQRSRRHHSVEMAALVHGDGKIAGAEKQLSAMVRDLIAEAAKRGEVRTDVPPAELASYALHALAAAATVPTVAATRRLVQVTLTGLRRPVVA